LEKTMDQPTKPSVLVVGASGATGRLLVGELLARGNRVTALVRSADRLPADLLSDPHLSVLQAGILSLDATELGRLTRDCDAIASCLGHNATWRGIFGPPYRLVTGATRRLTGVLKNRDGDMPARFVLMNSAGNSNRDLPEPISLSQRIVIGMIRLLIQPHADNEAAADFLRTGIGRDDESLEWCVVRPATLTNETGEAGYQLFASPIRSAIFDPGRTSRQNVARFMADLLTDREIWREWRGRMPVIYDTQ